MSDYISKEKLFLYMDNEVEWQTNQDRLFATEVVSEFETEDVIPVVHGRWIEYPKPHYFKCSICKTPVPYKKAMVFCGKRQYKYCPNCGAKMYEED